MGDVKTEPKLCPKEKPICIRAVNYKKKNRSYKKCNNTDFNIFDQFTNAYNIKREAESRKDPPSIQGNEDDRIDQCVDNDKNADDCRCSDFDFAWLTAIGQVKRLLRDVSQSKKPPTQTPEEMEQNESILKEATKGADKKRQIYSFFEQISECMRKNLEINGKVNEIQINILCDAVTLALKDVDKALTVLNKQKTEDKKMNKLNDYIAKLETEKRDNDGIYKFVFSICLQETMLNGIMNSVTNKVGPNEVGPNEVGPNEVGPNEVGPNEVGPNEVDAKNTDTNYQADILLLDTSSFFDIGKYVMNNSTTFDEAALKSTREICSNLYEKYIKINPKTKWEKFKGYTKRKWSQLKTYAKEHPFRLCLNILLVAAAATLPFIGPGAAIGLIISFLQPVMPAIQSVSAAIKVVRLTNALKSGGKKTHKLYKKYKRPKRRTRRKKKLIKYIY